MTAIRIWYGSRQRVGHLGDGQDDYNLLGEVEAPGELVSLTCQVGDRLPPWPQAVGDRADGFGDGRRLARGGHFNADIPVACLAPGPTPVILVARWRDGSEAREEVTLDRSHRDRPLPVDIHWSQETAASDAGLCVDGEWVIRDGALRTAHTGYDRVFLIGTRGWRDYEVVVPVTIHGVDTETGPVSGGNGLGLLFRFTGHVTGGPRGFPPGQPKWGYQPFGAITWLRWQEGADQPPHEQFYRGDRDDTVDHGTREIKVGGTYWLRGCCTSLPEDAAGAGRTRYAFQIWRDGEPEPARWAWEEEQVSATANRAGGVALLAHHVDASFGDVSVRGVGA